MESSDSVKRNESAASPATTTQSAIPQLHPPPPRATCPIPTRCPAIQDLHGQHSTSTETPRSKAPKQQSPPPTQPHAATDRATRLRVPPRPLQHKQQPTS